MKTTRGYRMTSRAAAAAETGRRILQAMQALFEERPYDRITLEAVATRAGVTLQTVLRRFGSKDRLLAAAAADAGARVQAERDQAPVDDLRGAIRNLFDHYERWARVALRLLEQEERIPEVGALTRDGRQVHAAWVERVFATAMRGRRGAPREILRSQLVAVTDVYVWKILRQDRGLDRATAERAVIGLVEALVAKDGA